MRKNIGGQFVGAQMTTATDGSNFTGAVSVFVTIDAGTQAAGTVGGGACTHEGNGYHTYAPSQAETNGDLVAFTFTAGGAVTATVQIYTAPTDYLDDVGDEVEARLLDYGALRPTVPGRTLDVTAGGEAGIDWGNIGNPGSIVNLSQTTIGFIGSSGLVAASFDATALAAITDAVLTRDWTLVTGEAARSTLNALRFLRNRWAVAAGTLTVTEEDDATVAWTAVTVGTPGADPITSVDPT